MEKQIFLLLQQVNEKIDHFGVTLQDHGRILRDHGETLKEHGEILKEHGEILKAQGEQLKVQGETLKEHGRILSALRSGQEAIKAELSELKLQNAKEFGEIREQLQVHEDSIEILKDESWNTRKDVLRVQKTLGLT